MSDLKFEILKNLGDFGEGREGWKKEINLVSWNERKPKLDIREWDETHSKMKKGMTFNAHELKVLKNVLIEFNEQSLEA